MFYNLIIFNRIPSYWQNSLSKVSELFTENKEEQVLTISRQCMGNIHSHSPRFMLQWLNSYCNCLNTDEIIFTQWKSHYSLVHQLFFVFTTLIFLLNGVCKQCEMGNCDLLNPGKQFPSCNCYIKLSCESVSCAVW